MLSTFCIEIAVTSAVVSPWISPTVASTPVSVTRIVGSKVPEYIQRSPILHVGTSDTPGSYPPECSTVADSSSTGCSNGIIVTRSNAASKPGTKTDRLLLPMLDAGEKETINASLQKRRPAYSSQRRSASSSLMISTASRISSL